MASAAPDEGEGGVVSSERGVPPSDVESDSSGEEREVEEKREAEGRRIWRQSGGPRQMRRLEREAKAEKEEEEAAI